MSTVCQSYATVSKYKKQNLKESELTVCDRIAFYTADQVFILGNTYDPCVLQGWFFEHPKAQSQE